MQPPALEAARLTAASNVQLAPVQPTLLFRRRGARGDEQAASDGRRPGGADEVARIKQAAHAAFRGPEREALRAARRRNAAARTPEDFLRAARIDRHTQVWGMPLSSADSRLIGAGTLTHSAYEQVQGKSVLALQEQLEQMQMHLWRLQAYEKGAMVGDDAQPRRAVQLPAEVRHYSLASKGLARRQPLPPARPTQLALGGASTSARAQEVPLVASPQRERMAATAAAQPLDAGAGAVATANNGGANVLLGSGASASLRKRSVSFASSQPLAKTAIATSGSHASSGRGEQRVNGGEASRRRRAE